MSGHTLTRVLTWGLLLTATPASAQSLAVPRGDPNRWVGWFDYPRAAFREKEQGAVFALLSVDERGRVTDCTVTHSSGSQTLDVETCKTWKRRAFLLPATDASGTPIKGHYVVMRDWRIEQWYEKLEPTNNLTAYAFCRAIEPHRPGATTRRVFVSSIRTIHFRDEQEMRRYANSAPQDAWLAVLHKRGVSDDAWAYCSWQFGKRDAYAERQWYLGRDAPSSFRATAINWMPPK